MATANPTLCPSPEKKSLVTNSLPYVSYFVGACDYTCQALYYRYTCIIAKEAIITMYHKKQRK